jgi:hypothetical protein
MRTAKHIAAQLKAATGSDIDPKFFNQVSQFAHFGMMYFVMTLCSALSARFLPHWWVGLIWGFAISLAYGIWHEFFWDPKMESPATRGSDLEDFFFLEFGAVIGALVYVFLIRA